MVSILTECMYGWLTGPSQQVHHHTTGSGCWLGGRKPLLVWPCASHHRGVQTQRVVPNSPGQHWPGHATVHSCRCTLRVRALWWDHEPHTEFINHPVKHHGYKKTELHLTIKLMTLHHILFFLQIFWHLKGHYYIAIYCLKIVLFKKSLNDPWNTWK